MRHILVHTLPNTKQIVLISVDFEDSRLVEFMLYYFLLCEDVFGGTGNEHFFHEVVVFSDVRNYDQFEDYDVDEHQ